MELGASRRVLGLILFCTTAAPEGLVQRQPDLPVSRFEDPVVRKLSVNMDLHPHDAPSQINGCKQLQAYTQKPGLIAEQAWNQMAKAAVGNSGQKEVAMTCVRGFASVSGSRALTLALHKTSAVQSLVQVMNQYAGNEEVQEELLQVLGKSSSAAAPDTTQNVLTLGGYRAMMLDLQTFHGHPKVMMGVWRALAPHSQNPTGAYILANWGGPGAGIHKMAAELDAFPEPHYAQDASDGLTLKYEIVSNLNGILQNDYTDLYGRYAIEHGLPARIARVMDSEADLRSTQDVCCKALGHLTSHDASAAQALFQAGAIDSVLRAISSQPRFAGLGSAFNTGAMQADTYPAVSSCAAVLLNVARTSVDNRQKMIQMGVGNTLSTLPVEKQDIVRPILYLLSPTMVNQTIGMNWWQRQLWQRQQLEQQVQWQARPLATTTPPQQPVRKMSILGGLFRRRRHGA